MNNSKFYIKGLDEIRAIASLGVLVHHVELYKFREGRSSLIEGSLGTFFQLLGKNCVFIFFCLSGFLITALLLKEKREGGISITSFYKRRSARILPLYYGLVLISFLIVPLFLNAEFLQKELYYPNLIREEKFQDVILYLFVLPNLALVLGKLIPGVSQSWSIGVEEQFYLIWPWVIKKIKEKYLPLTLLILALFKIIVLNKLSKYFNVPILNAFINQFALEYMAIGGIAGWVYLKKSDFALMAKMNDRHWLLLTFVLGSLCLALMIQGSTSPYKSVLYSAFILAVANTNIQTKLLSDIGQKSYGIYMYHPLIIFFISGCISYLDFDFSSWQVNTMLYSAVILFTYTISTISFNYFESPMRRFFTQSKTANKFELENRRLE